MSATVTDCWVLFICTSYGVDTIATVSLFSRHELFIAQHLYFYSGRVTCTFVHRLMSSAYIHIRVSGDMLLRFCTGRLLGAFVWLRVPFRATV